jgi:hypothetical protein
VSGNGANPEEMDFSHPDIANFARAVRTTLVTEPDPAVSAAMVRRLADESRASAAIAAERAQRRPTSVLEPSRRRSGARRRLALVALAVAALPLVTAGLAVAGVKLPAAVDDAFQTVGVDLPNQTDSAGQGDSDADRDQGSGNDGTPGASPAAEPGGDKAVKGGKRRGNGPPDHSNAGGNQSPGSNGKAKGKPASPPGQSGGGGPPPHSNAGGNGKGVGANGTPPGQANKPASPGNSGSTGNQGQGQGGGKPPKP